MTGQLVLIKAIRSGNLAEVKAALDAGAPVEIHDGAGDPGLPLGVACFMGFPDIVRELVARGAKVNLPDNNAPTSPLNMAKRGGKIEMIRTLLEMGADLPESFQTGLSEHEVMLAQLKAIRSGFSIPKDGAFAEQANDYEEIEVIRCAGTDTAVLEADVIRAARAMK